MVELAARMSSDIDRDSGEPTARHRPQQPAVQRVPKVGGRDVALGLDESSHRVTGVKCIAMVKIPSGAATVGTVQPQEGEHDRDGKRIRRNGPSVRVKAGYWVDAVTPTIGQVGCPPRMPLTVARGIASVTLTSQRYAEAPTNPGAKERLANPEFVVERSARKRHGRCVWTRMCGLGLTARMPDLLGEEIERGQGRP